MHADAEPKHYLEQVYFRARRWARLATPRALIKQGDTNMGASRPTAPASHARARAERRPIRRRFGASGASAPLPVRPWSYRGDVARRARLCARQAGGMACDESALRAANSASAFISAVASTFVCTPPMVSMCSDFGPSIPATAMACASTTMRACARRWTAMHAPPSRRPISQRGCASARASRRVARRPCAWPASRPSARMAASISSMAAQRRSLMAKAIVNFRLTLARHTHCASYTKGARNACRL